MRSKYDGVKYYSDNDMSLGLNLAKAEDLIIHFNEARKYMDINYILELFNICLLFESEVRLKKWNEDYYKELKFKVNTFMPIIGRYYAKIQPENINTVYLQVTTYYLKDFWKAFDKFDTYERFSPLEFQDFLFKQDVPIHYILIHKKIVDFFDREISYYLKYKSNNAKLLISHHLVRKEHSKARYNLPKSLSSKEQMDIIDSYIDSDDPNPNYLAILIDARKTKVFPISDKMRLKAANRYQGWAENISRNGSGHTFGATIGFGNINEIIEISGENNLEPTIIYGRYWLEENLDNPTLLNNFIYLFGYVDKHFRSTFPSKVSEFGALENHVGLKGNREYRVGSFFRLKEIISDLQIRTYSHELLNFDKRIEEIFQWFFEEYLDSEFGADGFAFSPPSANSTCLEKMRTMCSELDSILRQFTLYVREGEINSGLLEITRDTPLVEEVPSFACKKYGYTNDSELLKVVFLLFSDQAHLSYIESAKGDYSTFEQLVENRKIKISDFYHYQKSDLFWLLDKDVIYEDEEGFIRINNKVIIVLKDFYNNEVICITYYENNSFMKELITNNKIVFEGKLFSKMEQNYLNFMLNDREFDNGPALRNKYSHGNNPQNLNDHENDYYKLLKIFVLVIIKINEEFCLREDVWRNVKIDNRINKL